MRLFLFFILLVLLVPEPSLGDPKSDLFDLYVARVDPAVISQRMRSVEGGSC
jgi:hypothetical protein